MKAIWNNQAIAESEETIVIEGNHYFPADAINKDFFYSQQQVKHLPLERRGRLFQY